MRKILCTLFTCFLIFLGTSEGFAFDGEILAPKKLEKGDKICIIEASITNQVVLENYNSRIDLIVEKLKDRGFEVVVYEDVFVKTPLELGEGTEKLRADLFNKAVHDPEIKAIFAFCGGYGAMQVLDKIDYDAFRDSRKIFVGFSDETAIELAIFEKAGVITFHVPMVGSTLNYEETRTFDNLFDILMNPRKSFELRNIDDDSKFKVYENVGQHKNKYDKSSGKLVGGNLCLMQNLVGTPYEPNYENKILFFEEVEESCYRIHRTLWHLKLAGKLDNVSGIVIGKLTPVSCESEEYLRQACFDVLKDVNVPIIYNVHAGHIKNPLTLPIGADVSIIGENIIVNQYVVC